MKRHPQPGLARALAFRPPNRLTSGDGDSRRNARGWRGWSVRHGSEICEICHRIDSPDGSGIAPDGKTLHVSETNGAQLWAWTITGPGEVRKMRGQGSA